MHPVKMNLIPGLVPPKHSIPVPEELMQSYWGNLEPRLHENHQKELQKYNQLCQDWQKRGGYDFLPFIVPDFGAIISFIIPECDPQKLIEISDVINLGFIEDDLLDGDIFVTEAFKDIDPGSPTWKSRVKRYQNIVNQFKSKLFIELLAADDAQNVYVQSYEQWAKSDMHIKDGELKYEFRSLEDYLVQRLDNVGASCFWNMVPIVHKFNFTEKDIEALDPIVQQSSRMVTLLNDLYSAEKEWNVHANLDKPGLPISGVYVVMSINDISLGEAKEIVKQTWLEMEQSFLQIRDKTMEECDPQSAPEYARYISCFQYIIAGTLLYSANCPRYHLTPHEAPFYPMPEHKIRDLPRRRSITQNRKVNGISNGVKHEISLVNGSNGVFNSHTNGNTLPSNCAGGINGKGSGKAPWLAKYAGITEEVIIEPFRYIKSMPSKGIRGVAIDALDLWYIVPDASLEIIRNIIDMLHSASLIIDDIEDGSDLRRGQPSTHMVFGTPQSINTANYIFVKCLSEAQKLSPSAVTIFGDELRNLHLGQGLDLYWTFHQRCPSEAEYIQMIDGKTGGLFRMAARLMRDQATKNRDLEVEDLVTLMGRFFQIRDDYQNLGSVYYARAKGSLSDLDEGKYSFMLIHALKNTKNNQQLKSLLQLRSQRGVLTAEQKDLIMKIMTRSKSMEYTANVLEDLRVQIELELEEVEDQLVKSGFDEDKNWLIRAIMARLRLPDPKTRSLMKT